MNQPAGLLLGSWRMLWLASAVLLSAGVVAVGEAAAEPAPRPATPTDAQFARYRQELNATADNLLAVTVWTPPPPVATPELGESTPTAAQEELVRVARQHWGGREESFRRAFDRLQRLQPELTPILRAEGVPVDLAAVVLVESGAWTAAESPRGARGLWQFIPATARRYGLEVTPGRDDRLDTERATRAAARYLHDLYERFGSWALALAAYNAGEEAVARAIERAGGADFHTLAEKRLLPAETRDFVPAVLAVRALLASEPTH